LEENIAREEDVAGSRRGKARESPMGSSEGEKLSEPEVREPGLGPPKRYRKRCQD